MSKIVYFSSISENTKRFIEKLAFPEEKIERIPLRRNEEPLVMDEDFVLITPTYGGGNIKGAVPKQVIHFLNDERNRNHLKGVISSGNTNFGEAYCLAGDIIAAKCKVPHMYKFELLGTSRDITKVKEGLEQFWQR